ncbi:MAG TPA: CaiB/BaiF CoA-transferase family protein [Cyclobacteriaceae bacterium]|nr:CaiB/BaiF CoA-transferase family protein [Cyclobacteriaceae bacterium]
MFDNLRVLELASVLAGPSVGQFFAELGADVIKVENITGGGDVTRSWKSAGENTDDRSAYFSSVNWGKRSLAVDLTTKEGRLVIQKLAAKSDLVITSYKPGDDIKLGVSYEDLQGINSKIIYGRITGYGPLNDRVGYDAVLQAESGFMSLNGEENGPPIKMPVALIDVLAAHQLKEGLLIALLKLERTGEGSLVDVSLIQSAVASLVNQASNWLVGGSLPTRKGSLHPNIAPYGEWFETKDGKKLLLAIGNDRQFNDLCKLLKLDVRDRYATNVDRVRNRNVLGDLIATKIRQLNMDELQSKINQLKIPAGVIQDLREVFEMPQAKELLLSGEGLKGVRSFVARSGNAPQNKLTSPPHLGQHNDEILNSL